MRRADGDDPRPLVLHIVYRFDTGGLENGVVNLINHMPEQAFRHAVVALTDVVPAFAARIRRGDVRFASLHKPPGHGARLYPRLHALLREWRPAVVHTRNLAALECQVPAWWASVPVRLHGEHGRDVDDPDGTVRRYQWMRRLYRPFVDHHVALSSELQSYLVDRVGVSARRVTRICNGVDTVRFAPPSRPLGTRGANPFPAGGAFVVGTVGRMQAIKAQTVLAQAFVRALQIAPELRTTMRLAMVGEGPLREECTAILRHGGALDLTWLPGERIDVPDVMRGFDCFVLPSLAEGISNTILEAMSTGLPVLATRVGGNAELVVEEVTGALVPAADVESLAAGLVRMARDPLRAAAMGAAGRERVESGFSLRSMVDAYQGLYSSLLERKRAAGTGRMART